MSRFKALYHEYPSQFWLLMFGTFIDRTGGALLFTYFALYITKKFDVGMTEAGIVFLIFAVSGMISGIIGGALTDRLGRKGVVLFGLVITALSSLIFVVIDDLMLFYVVAMFVGLLQSVGYPGAEAMLTDMLPEEKRADGFGIERIVANMAVTIGPMFGAILASYSFTYLFIADSVTSIITAILLFIFLKETMPQSEPMADGEPRKHESMRETFRGYRQVLNDNVFVLFIVIGSLMGFVYIQMYSTLSVFLRDYRGFAEYGFGYMMSMNALMVVVMQLPITRFIRPYPVLLVVAAGSVFYAIGFGMYGFISATWLFFVGMAVITIGEMVATPVLQSMVARFAPDHMRGRYMAMYGLSWSVPHALGPILAGLYIDNISPTGFWYVSGVLGLVAAVGFVWLHQRTLGTAVAAPLDAESKKHALPAKLATAEMAAIEVVA